MRRTAGSLFLLSVLLMGCGAADDAPLTVDNETELRADLQSASMAIAAFRGGPTTGAFVVPSDAAVLTLDADSLADLAVRGDFEEIVERGALAIPADRERLASVTTIDRRELTPLTVSQDGDDIYIEGLLLEDIVEWGDRQLVIVGGVLQP